MSAALHVLFTLSDTEYVVAATDVLHMESFTGATKVPGTEQHVLGVMQIRQRVVPIVDMRMRFGLPGADPTLDSRVIVVQREQRAVGLLVDSAREVVQIAPEAFEAPPAVVTQRAQGFVTSLARSGSRLVMLIDLEKVIGQEVMHGE
jgi:purine-binding chemotaxis protein CheW